MQTPARFTPDVYKRQDITYVTNNELGFDYLRDNMAIYKEQMVLRELDYAIIDEVEDVYKRQVI